MSNDKKGGQMIQTPHSNQKPKDEKPEKRETFFRYKDMRILREALSNLHRKAPPMIQKKINTVLKEFAVNVKPYCECDEKVFIEKEKRFACLTCGHRHKTPEGDKVKSV